MKGVMWIDEPKLIFIGNELLDPTLQRMLNIPFQFITYAIVEHFKLYKHYRNDGTFLLRYGKDWGNLAVYGAIFAIPDFEFYIRQLDSYHQCSKSVLLRNHARDVHHRILSTAIPISFNSVEDLEVLKYTEGRPIDVQLYEGNLNHPKITKRLTSTISYRLLDGVDKNYIKLIREVEREQL